MKFHHGGRLGDAIFALYVAAHYNNVEFFLSLYHAPDNWNRKLLTSLAKFINAQPYIVSCSECVVPNQHLKEQHNKLDFSSVPTEGNFDVDFIDVENHENPNDFPERDPRVDPWINSVHMTKRYAHYFNVPFDPEAIWLTSPTMVGGDIPRPDVVFHCPPRRAVRASSWWKRILGVLANDYTVAVVGSNEEIGYWGDGLSEKVIKIKPKTIYELGILIRSCHLFLGGVSVCNAMAEGMKQVRFVEVAQNCYNTYPYGLTGRCVNTWQQEDVIRQAKEVIEGGHLAAKCRNRLYLQFDINFYTGQKVEDIG